jgi:hypothetical protein
VLKKKKDQLNESHQPKENLLKIHKKDLIENKIKM